MGEAPMQDRDELCGGKMDFSLKGLFGGGAKEESQAGRELEKKPQSDTVKEAEKAGFNNLAANLREVIGQIEQLKTKSQLTEGDQKFIHGYSLQLIDKLKGLIQDRKLALQDIESLLEKAEEKDYLTLFKTVGLPASPQEKGFIFDEQGDYRAEQLATLKNLQLMILGINPEDPEVLEYLRSVSKDEELDRKTAELAGTKS